MKGQALYVELQNCEQQGISIWLNRSLHEEEQTVEIMAVRDDISYMQEFVVQSGGQNAVQLDENASS